MLYVISELHNSDVAKGVFTNKKILYDAVQSICKNCSLITFSGIIKYESKTVNYTNMLKLLNILLVNESFYVNIVDNDDSIRTFEIKKLEQNKLFN